jgi:hypothetical protein
MEQSGEVARNNQLKFDSEHSYLGLRFNHD